jgi:protein translocase SecG subunit
MFQLIVAVQVILSLLLCLCILLQHRAAGLSATFGGQGGAYVQRRGAEKLLYQLTVLCAVAIGVLTVLQWYV